MVNLVSRNSHQQTQAEHMETLDSYLQKGNDYKQKEQWEDAIACYRTFLETNPDNWQAQQSLGDCLLNLERWQEASGAYREALKVKPDFIWAHHNLGIVLVNLERFEEAYECFEKVREQKPDFWDVAKVKYSAPLQQKLGDYLFKQQRWEEAVTVYKRVIALNPDFAWGYANLGRTLLEMGKFEEALINFKSALEIDSNLAWIHYFLGDVFSELEDWDKAINAYQKAFKLNQELPYLQQKLGYLLGKSKNPENQEAQTKAQLHLPEDFNWQEYLELNRDLQSELKTERQVTEHFLNHGCQEGRVYSLNQLYYKTPEKVVESKSDQADFQENRQCDSSEDFNWQFYTNYNPDLSNLNPEQAYDHWLNHGKAEGRIASESQFYEANNLKPSYLPTDFDWQEYVQLNLDLQKEIKTKWKAISHYLTHGLEGGRIYKLEQLHQGKQVAEKSILREITEPVTPSKVQRLAVLVHIYYYDLWPELRDHLNNIQAEFDLFVNVVESVWNPTIHEGVRRDFPEARILITKNRGRDIGGFLALMGHLDFAQYDLLCFLHTKKSPHISHLISNQWRTDLISALLGSKEKAKTNLEIMRRDPQIGLLASRYWRNKEVLNNSENYAQILDDFEVLPEARDCEYISGTMMFVRPQVMKPIYDKFGDVELEDGDGKDVSFHMDGQVAHSIERLIGNLVKQQGLEFFWQE